MRRTLLLSPLAFLSACAPVAPPPPAPLARMPIEVQEAAGCVIGRDYPEPIVDHAQARRAALARYGAVR